MKPVENGDHQALPESDAALARDLVSRLGGHPAAELELDLESGSERELGQWLVAACLLTACTRDERRAHAAFRALRQSGLTDLGKLAKSDPLEPAVHLAAAGVPKPEAMAQRLVRLSLGLERDYGGSLQALANQAGDLEGLASRLGRLAPGFGRAGVHRFLQPLRDVWPGAADLPLHPAARAAALHLGLLAPGQDEEGGPGALKAAVNRLSEQVAIRNSSRGESALRGAADTPSGRDTRARRGRAMESSRRPSAPLSFRDVEAALVRLGRRSCLREQTSRCPLGARCPVSARAPALAPPPSRGDPTGTPRPE